MKQNDEQLPEFIAVPYSASSSGRRFGKRVTKNGSTILTRHTAISQLMAYPALSLRLPNFLAQGVDTAGHSNDTRQLLTILPHTRNACFALVCMFPAAWYCMQGRHAGQGQRQPLTVSTRLMSNFPDTIAISQLRPWSAAFESDVLCSQDSKTLSSSCARQTHTSKHEAC